jgi:hypothetical protein
VSDPSNSLLDRPYPSMPASRYRQSRVGNREQGTTQNSVWSMSIDATGGAAILGVRDAQGHPIRLTAGQTPTALETILTFSFNANAATVQAAIEGYVGVGNVTVSGGVGASGGGTPYVLTFVGEMAGQRVFVGGNNGLLSGGGTTITLTETTVGGTPDAAVPVGPSLSTKDAVPANGPVAREA